MADRNVEAARLLPGLEDLEADAIGESMERAGELNAVLSLLENGNAVSTTS